MVGNFVIFNNKKSTVFQVQVYRHQKWWHEKEQHCFEGSEKAKMK